MSSPLAGRRALVTGGSKGAGKAIVERLRELGADVTINYKTTPEWGKLARQMTGHGVDLVVEVGGVGDVYAAGVTLYPSGIAAISAHTASQSHIRS